jgi:spore coat protein U-like protein
MQIASAKRTSALERASRHAWRALASLSLLCGALPAAQAGADCSITTTGLAFGAYDAAATQPADTTATVTVTCTYVPPSATNVSYTITASNGMNGTSPTARSMSAGQGRLAYNVFTDPSRTRLLGTGTGGTVVASGTMTVGPGVGNGTRTRTHTIYGRSPAQQPADPGNYLDTLVLTLTY